jgi:hypothetical protein
MAPPGVFFSFCKKRFNLVVSTDEFLHLDQQQVKKEKRGKRGKKGKKERKKKNNPCFIFGVGGGFWERSGRVSAYVWFAFSSFLSLLSPLCWFKVFEMLNWPDLVTPYEEDILCALLRWAATKPDTRWHGKKYWFPWILDCWPWPARLRAEFTSMLQLLHLELIPDDQLVALLRQYAPEPVMAATLQCMQGSMLPRPLRRKGLMRGSIFAVGGFSPLFGRLRSLEM